MKVRHNFKNSNISCIHTIPDTRYEHPVFFTGRLIFINIQAQQLMCYKVFLLLTAWKSVRELILSLHCFWGAGPSCCEGKTLPVKSIFQASGRQPLLALWRAFLGLTSGLRMGGNGCVDLLSAGKAVSGSACGHGESKCKIELRENRWELHIVDNCMPVLCLGTGTGWRLGFGRTYGWERLLGAREHQEARLTLVFTLLLQHCLKHYFW